MDAFCVIEKIVFPCHPRTEKNLKQFGLWDKLTKKVSKSYETGWVFGYAYAGKERQENSN